MTGQKSSAEEERGEDLQHSNSATVASGKLGNISTAGNTTADPRSSGNVVVGFEQCQSCGEDWSPALEPLVDRVCAKSSSEPGSDAVTGFTCSY